jgi:hypothetical protein
MRSVTSQRTFCDPDQAHCWATECSQTSRTLVASPYQPTKLTIERLVDRITNVGSLEQGLEPGGREIRQKAHSLRHSRGSARGLHRGNNVELLAEPASDAFAAREQCEATLAISTFSAASVAACVSLAMIAADDAITLL